MSVPEPFQFGNLRLGAFAAGDVVAVPHEGVRYHRVLALVDVPSAIIGQPLPTVGTIDSSDLIPELPTRDVTGVPLLKPGSKDAHERGEDRVNRANKAGSIRLHDEICPDGRDQVEDSPCGGEDAIRPHEDRVSQRCISVVAVFGVMSG